MGVGFRTGLFGYNKQEVNEYLGQQSQKYKKVLSEKDEQLSAQAQELEDLRQALEESNRQLEELKSQLTFLNGQLEHYRGREDEIEKMSIGIGTMYLASRQSATEILQRAEQCSAAVAEQTKKQLDAAAQTEDVLTSIRENVLTAAEDFSRQIEEYSTQLSEAAAGIEAGLAELNRPLENALPGESQNG